MVTSDTMGNRPPTKTTRASTTKASREESTMAQWKIDPDHVSAGFTVRHMMATLVQGLFTEVRGAILFDPEEPAATFAHLRLRREAERLGWNRNRA
jgi:polyisoprenoid-binding protein YceI